jgi:hypothetical protein
MVLSTRFCLLLILFLTIFIIQIKGIIIEYIKICYKIFSFLGLLFQRWCLGAHQEYLTCGSACPLTCGDVRNARYNKPCTYQCMQGCFCKRGYARRTHPKSQCIPDWRC